MEALVRNLRRLLRNGVENVIKEARQERLGKPKSVKVEDELGYFVNKVERMKYKTFGPQTFLIGSGLIEAGFKTLIGSRCKQLGLIWDKPRAQHILAIGSIHASPRLWKFRKERTKTHAAPNDYLALPVSI